MSKAGRPYDTACVERFFSAAQRACIYPKDYGIIDEVKRDLFGCKSPVKLQIVKNGLNSTLII